jgi:NADH:ubiquinone oxidoreductase subunit K
MGSIALSVVGAVVSLLDPRLFVLGVILFALGLITGIVALRRGVRKNLAIVGIILNAANLVFDAGLLILAGSR